MKKKIAISYQNGCIGGTTTSLLFFLSSLNYDLVDVTLFLYDFSGPFINRFFENKKLRVLHVGTPINKLSIVIYSIFSLKLFKLIIKNLFKKHFFKYFRRGLEQIGGEYRSKKSTLNRHENYDLSIGFMEFWSNHYSLKINAKKHICIIHPDYKNAFFNYYLDRCIFDKADYIGFVSKTNCSIFNKISNGAYLEKVIFFPNIIDDKIVAKMSEEPVSDNLPNSAILLLTVSRINYFNKGFDRVLDVATSLKNKNIDFSWIIVGDGEIKKLKKNIKKKGLGEYFLLVGPQDNPYKYMKACDVFLLLSRYEGKPMSVTEAQILGKFCIVSDYVSSAEQIVDGVNGFIVSNERFDPDYVANLVIQSKNNSFTKNTFDKYNILKIIENIIYE